MSSNKSISTKKTITPRMFSDILKKNNTINSIKKELNNNRIRCKLLWYTLIKLNEQIDNFEELYSSLDNKSQEKLIDKLLKETHTIYTKYIECGEIDDSLDYELKEFISELKDKYQIVQPQIPIMYITRSASGTKKIKKKLLRRKSLAKQKK